MVLKESYRYTIIKKNNKKTPKTKNKILRDAVEADWFIFLRDTKKYLINELDMKHHYIEIQYVCYCVCNDYK
jgi:hypothetical protein